MSCFLSITQSDVDFKSMISDFNDIGDNQLDNNFQNLNSNSNVIQLKRGGIIIKTEIGNIQFGLPPETVKDSLNLGQEIPKYYIIPSKRFDKKYGVNVAEFEFPSYFNFFIKKSATYLICTQEAEQVIRTVFQETLLGPIDHTKLYQDFTQNYDNKAMPNFNHEYSIFNPQGPIPIDTLLKFIKFDQQTGEATIKQQNHIVVIKKEDNIISIIQNSQVIEQFKDIMLLKDEQINEMIKDFGSLNFINRQSFEIENHLSYDIVKQIEEQKNKTEQNFNVQRQQQKFNVMAWNSKGCQSKEISFQNLQNQQQQQQQLQQQQQNNNESEEDCFQAPDFGLTVLGTSHGFDPKGSTSGFIVWIYGNGIMVDPPPFAMNYLKSKGISSLLIKGIIISHCHADHDAGTFHKVLDYRQIDIITTKTIMGSFLRKYSALSDIPQENLLQLFTFRPAVIGAEQNIYGGTFKFFYALHTIPSMGFEVSVEGKKLYFSSDTFYDPQVLLQSIQNGKMTQERYNDLIKKDWESCDVILHEAGVPPIHTHQDILNKFPSNIKNKIYLYHIADKDVQKENGMKIVKNGIENTLILLKSNNNKKIDSIRTIDFLSSIDIFEQLNAKKLLQILQSLLHKKFKPLDIIVKEGEIGDKFYIISSGVARVFSNQDIKFVQIGDYFGEHALITQEKRTASIQALTELEVFFLYKHDFEFIFGNGNLDHKDGLLHKFKLLTQSRKSKAQNIFNKNNILGELLQSQKTQLEIILREQEVQKGQIIWKKNEKAKLAIIVKKGRFEFKDCQEENQNIELTSGAFIGETKAFFEKDPQKQVYTTTLQSITVGTIYYINKKYLIPFLQKNPGLKMLISDFKYFE